jgi:hypothetical protein
MRSLAFVAVAMAAALLVTAPAAAQFTGGVFVSAGDVSGAASTDASLKISDANMKFHVSKITFGAGRSLRPPTRTGPGIAQITLKRGYTEDVGQWFQTRSQQSAGQDGDDLLIVNNGDGPDFLEIHLSDVFISSYQTSASGDAPATVKYAEIRVIYTVQADDHSAN